MNPLKKDVQPQSLESNCVEAIFLEHDALQSELRILRQLSAVFQSASQFPPHGEDLQPWREMRSLVRGAHDCFFSRLPRHFEQEEIILYRKLHGHLSPQESAAADELLAEHEGLRRLASMFAGLIAPWLELQDWPPSPELRRFIGLAGELEFHLWRHIEQEEERILPIAAAILGESSQAPRKAV